MTSEDTPTRCCALAADRLGDWKAERERRIRAEKERDDAKYGIEVAKHQRDNWESIARQALAAQPRPLTPGDITDEMVGRIREMEDGYGRKYFASSIAARELLTAALTEPPARPEGAEDIERLLTEDLGDFSPPATPEAIADLLAARGVRVTGGN